MKNLYRVTFDTKMGGERGWAIDLEALNAPDAKAQAEARWYEQYKTLEPAPHMFHTKAKRLRDTEEFKYHWFSPRE